MKTLSIWSGPKRALGAMLLWGVATTAHAFQLTTCDCVNQTIQLRCGLAGATPISHWGDMVSGSDATSTVISAFPPPNGRTPEFRSLCGGPWVSLDAQVWQFGLSTGGFHALAWQAFREPDSNGMFGWVTRPNCYDYWCPGYQLNMDMRFGAAAGDYGPRRLDLAAGSSVMVPAQGRSYGWPTALIERPMAGEDLDMITGAPLLQETDFVLPFGSAVFRWQRTYSEISGRARHEYDQAGQYQLPMLHSFNPSSIWWDWAGQGWMVGAAPLLLIDETNWSSSGQVGEARCYFLPDAHHSVPFVFVPSQTIPPQNPPPPRKYEAPPRFGMVLSFDPTGVQLTENQQWVDGHRPREWYIWTNNSSLRYTFAPVYDDVGPEQPYRAAPLDPLEPADLESAPPAAQLESPAHFGPGVSLGKAHYAVLKRIDDLNGNRVDIEYQPFIREPLNKAATLASTPTGCVELIQQSQSKGQIKRVRLLSGLSTAQANLDTPTSLQNTGIRVWWTIVPVYRSFGGSDTVYDAASWSGPNNVPGTFAGSGIYTVPGPPSPPERFDNQHAIDSVYVYSSNYDVPINPQTGRAFLDQTIPYSEFTSRANGVELDRAAALHAVSEGINGAALCNLDDGWEYRVRYIYADGTDLFKRGISVLESRAFRGVGSSSVGWDEYPPLQSPRLLLTTTTHRAKAGPSNVYLTTTRHQMYRYLAQYVHDAVSDLRRDTPLDYWSLQGVWSSERIESIKDTCRRANSSLSTELLIDWPLRLMLKHAGSSTALTDDIPFNPRPPQTAFTIKSMLYSADRVFEPWGSTEAGYSSVAGVPTFVGSEFATEMYQGYLSTVLPGGTTLKPLLDRDGAAVYAERTDGEDGTFTRSYRFLLVPASILPNGTSMSEIGSLSESMMVGRAHFHHPYAVVSLNPTIGVPQTLAGTSYYQPDLATPLWAIVMDTHDAWDNAAWGKFLADHPTETAWHTIQDAQSQSAGSAIRKRMPTTRRIVLLNAAGSVITDRKWIFSGFAGGTQSSTGLWEERVYDWNLNNDHHGIGRLMQVRSVGWAAASQAGVGSSQGLIRIFSYDNREAFKNSMDVCAVGCKNGLTGAEQWQKQFIRDPQRQDLVRFEVDFLQPVGEPLSVDATFDPGTLAGSNPAQPTVAVTFRRYSYEDVPQPDGTTFKRVKREVTVRPPVAAPGGAPVYPVDVSEVDYGRAPFTDRWHGYGGLSESGVTPLFSDGALSTDGAQSFYVDLQRTDSQGRVVFSGADLSESASQFTPPSYFNPADGFDAVPPVRPAGWARHGVSVGGVEAPPLNKWIATDHCAQGPWRVENNNHAGDFYVYGSEPHPDPSYNGAMAFTTRIYKNCNFDSSDPQHATGNVLPNSGPGQITFYGEGGPPSYYGFSNHDVKILSQEVNWTGAWTNYPGGQESYTVLRDLELSTNSDGAPTDLKVRTPTGESREAHVAYTNLGEIQRQFAPDGTITRNVYDPLGKLLRVYRGTDDNHLYWGTAEPPTTGEPCGASYSDNLVLVEKHQYGVTPTDALKLIETRSYRDKPADQYRMCPNVTHNEDTIGWKTTQKYDWRMRSVVMSHFATGATVPTLSTATYFDHNDRVRLVATFEGAVPSSIDPSEYSPGQALPTAASLIVATTRRLSETIYNARGLVEEQRDYDPAPPSGAPYIATRTYYDYADRPIRVIHPGGGETTTAYNAAGQVMAESTFAGGKEATRTAYAYDTDGNAIQIETTERTVLSGDFLDSTNSVTSYIYKWYDSQKRITAIADLGTGTLADGVPTSLQNSFANSTVSLPARDAISPGPDPAAPPGVVTINRGTLPSWVKLTCYGYDAQGHESLIVNPMGTVTRKGYNAFGELVRQVDNDIGESEPNLPTRRVTVYKYDQGRLVKIAALLDDTVTDWETTVGAAQITEVLYGGQGAEVVNSSGNSFSPPCYNGGWIREVRFPNPVNGQPDPNNSLKFKYYITGEIAERTDQRGVTIKYTYDEASRMTRYALANIPATSWAEPLDLVRCAAYQFDALGQLLAATAWRQAPSSAGALPPDSALVSEVSFAYDSHGNLLRDRQQYGTHANSASATVDYDWNWAAASGGDPGHNRLNKMTYPVADTMVIGSPFRRELTFEYGAHSALGVIDNTLNRMSGILSTGGFGAAAPARYDYSGSGRRMGTRLGERLDGLGIPYASAQSYRGSGVGLDGLDSFGRVRDQWWKDSYNTTQRRVRTGYDQNDNPLHHLVSQAEWTGAGGGRDNVHSFKFGYDRLDRLTRSDEGKLNATLDAIETSGTNVPMPVLSAWGLGRVDSWNGVTGTSPAPGLKREGDLSGNGTWQTSSVWHDTDQTNQLSAVRTSSNGGTEVSSPKEYDRAGNLILDGTYFYEYDGLNRLMRVSLQGTLTHAVSGNTDVFSGTPGNWIVLYTYDALGRLIRAQRPWPSPSSNVTLLRVEHFHYDGVRRIQEVFVDPLEVQVIDSKGIDSKEEAQAAPLPVVANVTYCNREYIWGPDYVDELVAQVAPGVSGMGATEQVMYAITAHAGTMAAILDSGGAVHAQYTFDPYGELLAADVDPVMPRNRIGHQGLFFDRLTGGTADPQLGRGFAGHYYNRNRTYSPVLGRFLQKDPNGTGTPLVRAAYSGASRGFGVASTDIATQYHDGLNAHGYVRSRPQRLCDAFGTSAGLLTAETMEDSIDAAAAQGSLTGLQAVRFQLTKLLLKHYAKMIVGGEVLYGAATGLPDSPFGPAGAELGAMFRNIENIAGRNIGNMLELTSETFRSNLIALTGFKGYANRLLYHAHHIIPQTFASLCESIGINLHNPLFGQWVVAEEHIALHASGKYNAVWEEFLNGLKDRGVVDDDAYHAVFRFIGEHAEEWGFMVPFPQ